MASETIGARLRRARRSQGLSQRKLAQRADVRVMTVSDYERDVRQHPDHKTIEKLAEAERSVLAQFGRAAATEGIGLRPAAYSAALVILRAFGRPAE